MFCLGVFKYIKIFQVQKHLFFSIGVARRAMVPVFAQQKCTKLRKAHAFFCYCRSVW